MCYFSQRMQCLDCINILHIIHFMYQNIPAIFLCEVDNPSKYTVNESVANCRVCILSSFDIMRSIELTPYSNPTLIPYIPSKKLYTIPRYFFLIVLGKENLMYLINVIINQFPLWSIDSENGLLQTKISL